MFGGFHERPGGRGRSFLAPSQSRGVPRMGRSRSVQQLARTLQILVEGFMTAEHLGPLLRRHRFGRRGIGVHQHHVFHGSIP